MEDLIAKLGAWSVILLIGWWVVAALVISKVNDFLKKRKFEKEKKFHHINIPYYQSNWSTLEGNVGGLCFLFWIVFIFFLNPLRYFSEFFDMIANLNFLIAIILLFIWIPIALLDNYVVKKYIKRYREENLKND